MEEQSKDPSSFVIRVKKHPGTLRITRPSILKNAVDVKWSYEDQLEMTTKFNVEKKHIEDTWSNFKNNIAPRFDTKNRGLITFKASGREIIEMLNEQPNNFRQDVNHQMSKFIELSNDKGLLNDWTVALKITSNATESISAEKLGLNCDGVQNIQLAQRSGPSVNEGDLNSFLNQNEFKASGKNANIISANTDLAVQLSDKEIDKAKGIFYFNKSKELQKKNSSLTDIDALDMARKSKTIPERYYREGMSENQGVLIIYLFDSNYVFNQKGKNSIIYPELKKRFKEFVINNNLQLSIPLVGYVLGFPPMANDPGGIYMQGDYNLDLDEGGNDEGDDDLPNDDI